MAAPHFRMGAEEIWQAVDAERLSLVALLQDLDAGAWETPSLCAGWRVRDVAAHLTLASRTDPGRVMLEYVRSFGRFDPMMDRLTRRAGQDPPEAILANLRSTVGSRRLAPGTTVREPLLDLLVHGQDIAIPLGIARPVPVRAAHESAERVWTHPFPFHARRHLASFRLVATDTDWDRGTGSRIDGPVAAILLLLTGRPAALAHLGGDDMGQLAQRLLSRSR